MDKTVEINTDQEAKGEFTTEKIVGELHAVILSNEKLMQVEIWSELGYRIFKQMSERVGTDYFNVRTVSLNEKAEKMHGVASCFHLNEKLIIRVTGQRNATMRVTLRYG